MLRKGSWRSFWTWSLCLHWWHPLLPYQPLNLESLSTKHCSSKLLNFESNQKYDDLAAHIAAKLFIQVVDTHLIAQGTTSQQWASNKSKSWKKKSARELKNHKEICINVDIDKVHISAECNKENFVLTGCVQFESPDIILDSEKQMLSTERTNRF